TKTVLKKNFSVCREANVGQYFQVERSVKILRACKLLSVHVLVYRYKQKTNDDEVVRAEASQ
ncbi:MAG: hypothetical protein ACK5YS_03520, partial [bacterium]